MLIAIKTYITEAEAVLDLSILQNHQINGYLFNVFSATVYPISNFSIGGVELKVNEEDAEKALNILNNTML